MSQIILPYKNGTATPSRWATLSIWLAAASVALLLIALANFQLFAKPAFAAGDQPLYWRCKMYLTIIPAWTAMGLALTAGGFAIVGLCHGKASRIRSLIGLALCGAFLFFLLILA